MTRAILIITWPNEQNAFLLSLCIILCLPWNTYVCNIANCGFFRISQQLRHNWGVAQYTHKSCVYGAMGVYANPSVLVNVMTSKLCFHHMICTTGSYCSASKSLLASPGFLCNHYRQADMSVGTQELVSSQVRVRTQLINYSVLASHTVIVTREVLHVEWRKHNIMHL